MLTTDKEIVDAALRRLPRRRLAAVDENAWAREQRVVPSLSRVEAFERNRAVARPVEPVCERDKMRQPAVELNKSTVCVRDAHRLPGSCLAAERAAAKFAHAQYELVGAIVLVDMAIDSARCGGVLHELHAHPR